MAVPHPVPPVGFESVSRPTPRMQAGDTGFVMAPGGLPVELRETPEQERARLFGKYYPERGYDRGAPPPPGPETPLEFFERTGGHFDPAPGYAWQQDKYRQAIYVDQPIPFVPVPEPWHSPPGAGGPGGPGGAAGNSPAGVDLGALIKAWEDARDSLWAQMYVAPPGPEYDRLVILFKDAEQRVVRLKGRQPGGLPGPVNGPQFLPDVVPGGGEAEEEAGEAFRRKMAPLGEMPEEKVPTPEDLDAKQNAWNSFVALSDPDAPAKLGISAQIATEQFFRIRDMLDQNLKDHDIPGGTGLELLRSRLILLFRRGGRQLQTVAMLPPTVPPPSRSLRRAEAEEATRLAMIGRVPFGRRAVYPPAHVPIRHEGGGLFFT